MGKVIGIGLFVAAIWAGMEIQSQGLEGAFGGLLAPESPNTAQAASAPQRAGTAVDQAYREMEHRYDGAGE